MKKVLLLFIMLTATTALNLSWAQLGIGQQMQNNNFEVWSTELGTSNHNAPTYWHSIKGATGNYASAASSGDFVSQVNDNPGGTGSKCVKMTAVDKSVNLIFYTITITANGSISTGRFNAGATSADDTKNCTYTSTTNGYNQTMTAYPDSVYVWTKTSLYNSSDKARFNIVIHNNVKSSGASNNAIYQDPSPSTQNNSVVNTNSATNEGKAMAKATLNFNTNGNWVQQKVAFVYTNNVTPSYILATFSTNQEAGGGKAGDYLLIDDVILIYNTRLATLTVDGDALDGFNADVTSYNYPTPICEGVIPNVAGTCQSAHASTQIMHNPSMAEPWTTIRVKHLNQESTVYKDYRINYIITSAPAAPTVTSTPVCAPQATPVSVTANSTGASSYRWYVNETGGTGTESTSSSFTVPGIIGSKTYYISAVNANGCESGRTPVTVTINQQPDAPEAVSTSVCRGDTAFFTATPPAGDNLTFRWYTTNNSTGVLHTGTSFEIANLQSTTTRYASTYNTVTGCESANRIAVTVTVNDIPAVPSNLTGGSHCGPGTVTLSATPAAGTSCQWFAAETGGNALKTGNSYTTDEISEPTTTYYVASYNSTTGCSSARQAVVATINPIPTNPTVNGNELICPGDSLSLTATAGDNADAVRWYNSNEQQLSTNANYNTGVLNQDTSYIVKSYNTSTGCFSTGTTVDVTLKSVPEAPSLAGNSRCGSGNVTLSVNDPLNNATYTWYNANGTQVGTGNSYTATALTSTSNYYVTATVDGCTGASASVTATIDTLPAAPTGITAGSHCGASTDTLSATPAAGTVCQWFAAETGGDALKTGNSYTTSEISESTTYYVASYNSTTGCSSARQAVVATINPIPTPPSVSGNKAICEGSTLTLTATPGSNANAIKWYDSNEQLVSDNAVFTTPELNSGTTYYTAKSYNSSTTCISSGTAVAVVVNAIPAAPTLNSNSRCGTGDITLSVNNPNNDYTYTWYNDNDGEVNTDSSYTIQNLASTSIYHVTATANGCTGASASVTATIKDIPAAPSASNVEMCEAGTITLHVNNPVPGYTYNWFAAATGGSSLYPGDSYEVNISASPTSYYVDVTSDLGCTSTQRTAVTATISGNPSAPAVPDTSRCGAGNITLEVANANNAYIYKWYTAAEGGEAFTTGNSYTINNLQADTTLYVSVKVGNCESGRTAATAHIKAIPGAPSLAGDSLCGTGNITLNVLNILGDVTYTWYNANDEQVNIGTEYTIQNLASTTSYYVTATADGCTGASATVTATINAIPALPSVTPGAHCGEGTVQLSATAGENGNQVRWFNVAEGGEAVGFDNNYTTPTISEPTTTYYVASYNSSTQCIGARQSVVATINAIPAAPVSQNDTLCGMGQAAVLTAIPADNCNCKWLSANNTVITAGVSDDTRSLTTGNLNTSTNYRVLSVNPNTNCYSDTTDIQVIVAQVPGASTVSNNARCGAGAITLTATYGNNANTCRWYDSTSTLIHEGLSLEIDNLNYTSAYTCKSYNTNTGCESSNNNARTAIATIHPIPEAPTVNGNNPICGSGSLTLTGIPAANSTICRWINGNDTTTNNKFNTGNLTDTTNYLVQSYHESRGCASENLTVTVVVNTLPNVPQTGNDTQCLGTPVNLTATATENTIVRWYASAQDNNILYEGAVFHPENLVVGENNFYASLYDTLTKCTSANRSMATATMIDAPNIPNVADTAHCGPADFTLNIIDPDNNTTYKWYAAAQGGVAIHTGTTFTTGELSNTTHYYVSAAVANYDCESGRRDVTVTINSIPANPVVNDNEAICAGQTLTVSASSDAAATNFVWSDGQNETEGDSLTTPTLEDNANYTVKAYNANTHCESEVVAFTITVNPNPGIPKVGSDTQCEHDTIMLTAFAATGCTSYWYTSQESTESFANGDFYSTSTLPVGTTTYYVSQRDDITNCESERITVEAIINPTYAVNYPVVACDSFQWNNETFSESGNYERTLQTIHGCDSVVTLQLTINYSKVTNIDTTVCDVFVWNNQTYETSGAYQQSFRTVQDCDSTVYVQLTVKKSTVGSDHIYLCNNELPYNYNNLYTVTEAGTFTIHTENVAGCDSTITLTVTVNSQPAVAINLAPATRCGEGTVKLTAHAGQNGTTCRWYADETSTDVLFAGTEYTTESLTASTTFYVTSYNDYNGYPCESDRQAIVATVNPIPAEPAVSDQVRCGDGNVEFAATIDENATTCRWYLTANTTNVSATGLSYNPTLSVDMGNTAFYVESYNNTTGCKSSRKEVKAEAFAIPAVPVLTAMSHCGPQQFSIAAPANGYYKWYDSEGSTETLDINNNTTPMVDASRSYFISHAVDYAGISCESDKTELILTIYPVYEAQDLYDTLCQGETYTQHGLNETFDNAGAFDRVINTVSSTNCDSLVTLHLWVKEIRYYEFEETVCDSYTWNNETFTASENITRHFISSIGCDSVVTLHLTVNYSAQTEFSDIACDSYQWNNETYTQSGDYVQHFSTVNGCDSMVTLHLTINYSAQTEFSEIACDSYQWNNETYTQSGDYVQHFNTVNGCDSMVTLHLTVNYSNAANLNDAVCAGTRYNANGFDTLFITAGSYTLVRHDLNQAGCDSTTTLTLKVNPIYNQDVTLTICETALPYTWNDITYPTGTASGDYEHTYSTHTAAGCDSIVNLHLTISNQYITPLTADICEGETYPFAGHALNQSGIYYDTLVATNHCDSIIKLSLTVHELHTTNLNASICLGETYTENGFNETPEEVGTFNYQQIVQTSFGCDSTINLALTVNPVYHFTEYDTLCANELPMVWQGLQIDQEGSYTAEYQTINTCDSIITLYLTVNPVYNQTENATICQNELPYTWRDTIFSEETVSGEYTFFRSTINGCDSIVTLTLTVNPVYEQTESETICQNELPYTWRDTIFGAETTSGEYVFHRSTVNGCDSTVTLTLTVNPSYTQSENATICQNELPYTWRDTIFAAGTISGDYIFNRNTVNGCDSIVTLHLTVNPSYNLEANLTICQNELPYTWRDTIFGTETVGGDYVFSKSSVNGCDSIVTLHLTVNPSKHTDLYEEICEGDVYIYNNRPYEDQNDYNFTFPTVMGCDSTVTLHLTVHPVYSIDTTINICEGLLPYTFADTVFDGNGRKDIYLHTQHGCDSIYHVTLNVRPFITSTRTATICDNELPYHIEDSIFYQAGVYEVTVSHDDGCNEIITLTLNVNPTYNDTLTTTVCDQFIWNNETYTESGIYTQHFNTTKGCDSTVTYILTVNYSKDTLLTPVICLGDSYTENGFNLNPEEAGIIDTTVITQCVGTGCDSTIRLLLTVNPSYNLTIDTTVCGQFVWNDSTYTVSDIISHTFVLSTGCDSTVTYNLTVNPVYEINLDTTVCDQFVWNNEVYTESGNYTQYFSTMNHCDSTVTYNLTVNYAQDTLITAAICRGESYEENGFHLPGDNAGMIYDTLHLQCMGTDCDSTVYLKLTVNPSYDQSFDTTVCDHFVWNDIIYTESDIITYTYILATGCDSTVTYDLTVNPIYNDTLDITVCDTFVWNNEIYTESGIHTQYFRTINHCDSIFTYNLTVNHSIIENLTLTVCQSELPYTWRNKTFDTETTVGEHQFTYEMETVQGCDSTVNLTLIVNPNNEYYDDPITFCEGGSFEWHDTIITTSGIYTDTVANDLGCYDVWKIVATVNPVYHFTEYDTVCSNNLPIIWQNRQISEAGTHYADYHTVNGCDSVYTLILEVNTQPSVATNLSPASRCDEGSLTLGATPGANGTTCRWYTSENTTEVLATGTSLVIDNLTETTTYYVSSYNDYNGHPCESGRQAIIATLNISPAVPSVTDMVRCGDGEVEFTATVDEHANTCRWYLTPDATQAISTGLTYNPTISTSAENGTSFYVESYDTNTTCKSSRIAVNATAFAIPAVPELEPMSYCGEHQFSIDAPASGYYRWYDTEESENVLEIENNTTPTLNASRSYFISHVIDYTGISCESNKSELALTIYPVYEAQYIFDTICQGEDYVQHGLDETFDEAGSFDRVINTVSSNNCDSLVTLRLWVKEIRYYEFSATACDSYTWNDEPFTTSGNITRHFTSSLGCDSVVTLHLTINNSVENAFSATACDSYQWNDSLYTVGGDKIQHFQTTKGCDSTVTLHLTINYSVENAFSATACDSYQWNDSLYTVGGDKIQHFQTSKGCDSTVTLHLTINYSNSANISDFVCKDSRYNMNGFDTTFTEAGTYTLVRHDMNQNGCDSATTLTLTVTPTYNFEAETDTICDSEEYVWVGHEHIYIGTLTEGTYTFTDNLSTATFGCDSIHTLILTVNPTKHNVETASACSNEETYIWHNREITATGIYYDTLATSLRCDSVCELRFTLLEPTFAVFTDTTCANAEYQGYGFEVTPTLSGDTTLVRMTENVAGCDSTITVNLYVKPMAYSSFDTIVCGAFQWNNRWYVESGEYQQTFTAANGCDSIVTLNLIVDTYSRDTIEVVACESYEWDGHTYEQSGVYDRVYTQAVGCDSIAVMILTINHSTEVTLYDTTCQAHRYQGYGFDTLALLPITIHLQRIETMSTGCDSIINLMLTVHRGYVDTTHRTICENEDFVWHGIHCDTTGIYYKNYETVYGCDSVFVLFLTVHPSYEVNVTDTAIAGTVYNNHGLNFTPQNPGVMTIDVPRTSINGCDSTVHVTLVIIDGTGVDLHYLDKHITLFPNPTDNAFTVSSTIDMIQELTIYDNNGKVVLRQSINDYNGQVNVENLAPGIYFVRLTLPDNIVTKKLIVR